MRKGPCCAEKSQGEAPVAALWNLSRKGTLTALIVVAFLAVASCADSQTSPRMTGEAPTEKPPEADQEPTVKIITEEEGTEGLKFLKHTLPDFEGLPPNCTIPWRVRFTLTADESGNIAQVVLDKVEPESCPEVDAILIAAARQWKVEPVVIQGKAVRVTMSCSLIIDRR